VTYFVTRWWSTRGIVEVTGEVVDEGEGNHVAAKIGGGWAYFSIHTEAFPSLEAAELRVKALAARKVESLRSQAKAIEEKWLTEGK